jgi:hypothetical protein
VKGRLLSDAQLDLFVKLKNWRHATPLTAYVVITEQNSRPDKQNTPTHYRGGPGSLFGIATGYGLDGPGIESRWREARFSAPVQTGTGAHLASCKMGTGSFPGVKSGRCVASTPHPLVVPLVMKE